MPLCLIGLWVGYSQETGNSPEIRDKKQSLDSLILETETAIQAKKIELDELNNKVSQLASKLENLSEDELDSLLRLYEQEEQSRTELELLEKEIIEMRDLKSSQTPTLSEIISSGGQDFILPEINMEFIWVESMQCWVGKYEVTNSEYRFYNPNHSSEKIEGYDLNEDRQPAVYISYEDAENFAQWLTNREKESERLPSGWLFRLPSSEEWIKIAECGDGRRYPWGNDWPPAYGNYDDDTLLDDYVISDYKDEWIVSCPVESSGCNNWGVCGMGGNALEWTNDRDKQGFIVLGASWEHFKPHTLECNFSSSYPPGIRTASLGFRLILSVSN